MDYQQALEAARDRSLTEEYADCGVHVSAQLGKDKDGTPCIVGYRLDNWTDGTTVATFVNGWPR